MTQADKAELAKALEKWSRQQQEQQQQLNLQQRFRRQQQQQQRSVLSMLSVTNSSGSGDVRGGGRGDSVVGESGSGSGAVNASWPATAAAAAAAASAAVAAANASKATNSTLLHSPSNFGIDADVGNGNSYWAAAMLIVPLFTIFGNALVVLAVRKEKSLQTATNRFIVSLAFADIFVAAIVMPVSVYVEIRNGHWDFSNLLCDLWIMCDAMFSTASILNLVAISIDRFIAVTRPIQYCKHRNRRRTTMTILLTWLISIGIALPIGCGLQNVNGLRQRVEFENACTFLNGDFLIYSSLGSFYIPCIVMLVLYYRIFLVIRKRSRSHLANSSSGNSSAPLESRWAATDVANDASDVSNVVSDTGDTKLEAAGQKSRSRRGNAKIFRIRLHRRHNNRNNNEKSNNRRERKATKTLAIVLCVFLLCWLPFFITNLMWAACLKNIDNGSFFNGALCAYDRRIAVVIVWLGYMNSFMNPLIYTIFNNEFRKAFKKLLHIN